MTSGLPSVSEALIEKTADGSLTLGWDVSHVTYRSRYGAWTEAKHVFLDGTKALEATAPRIFEFGLGAATNLFATLGAFIESPALSQLNYTALECSPLPPELFDELVASYPLSDAARRPDDKPWPLPSKPREVRHLRSSPERHWSSKLFVTWVYRHFKKNLSHRCILTPSGRKITPMHGLPLSSGCSLTR